jgi:antitoxin (DNA-binding transcriptional repressor) of toxin-antitoxin stability system
MHIVNIHQAKTQLSKLIELAVAGRPFIIAKAGRPLVRVSAINAPGPSKMRRLGFMLREANVPDDFDRMGSEEIENLFLETE